MTLTPKRLSLGGINGYVLVCFKNLYVLQKTYFRMFTRVLCVFWLNCASVSDTPGMGAKQETGPEEKATDCGFVSTIKSGKHLLTCSTWESH